MKTIKVAGIITTLAVLMCITVPAYSQQRVKGLDKGNARSVQQPGSSHHFKRGFAPQVIGRASSFIITGRLVAMRGQRLSLETADGARRDFQMDEQTTLLESGELISIATMGDITLRPADLRLADEVEVVAERVGSRCLARIVTRTASGP